MRVLVTGGTGFIGRYLCEELDDRGHDVTALARSPDASVLPSGVDTVEGDVTDYETLLGPFEDQDAVVNLVALSPLYETPDGLSHESVHLDGTRNCVRAAEETGVSRLLQMSALDADPDARTAYLRAKGEAEQVVRESDLEWTIIRPSIVFGDGDEIVPFTKRLKKLFAPGVPFYPLPGGGKTPFQVIHVDDLVPMLADAVVEDEHVGEIYELGGPEVLKLADIARLVFRADGKRIRVVPLPMPLAKVGLAVLSPLPFFPFGLEQGRGLEVDNTVDDNDVTAFGVDPDELTTFSSYLGLEPGS